MLYKGLQSLSTRRRRTAAACALLTLLILASMLLSGCGLVGSQVNLDHYISVTFEGADGSGTAEAVFDLESFRSDHQFDITVNASSQEAGVAYLMTSDSAAGFMYANCVDFDLDKRSGLSNGDTVTVIWTVDDEKMKDWFNCSANYTALEFTVEGLE